MFGIFSNIAFVTTTSIIAIVICLALLLSWPLRVLFCSFAIFLCKLPMGLSTPLVLFLLLTCEVFKGFLWWFQDANVYLAHFALTDWLFGSDLYSLPDMKTTRFIVTFSHAPLWENLWNEVVMIRFAVKATTLAVDFWQFCKLCVCATRISIRSNGAV